MYCDCLRETVKPQDPFLGRPRLGDNKLGAVSIVSPRAKARGLLRICHLFEISVTAH